MAGQKYWEPKGPPYGLIMVGLILVAALLARACMEQG